MKLIIVHSHFRPGGVRRVIELATPYLVRHLRPPITEVVLAGADKPEPSWQAGFRTLVRPVPVRYATEPALGYLSEQKPARAREITARLQSFLADLLEGADAKSAIVWAHNHGLGRNLLLTRELARACLERKTRLVFHHHDWWFDNRWQRWPEMRRHEFDSLAEVAATVFPISANVRHVAINQSDAAVLARYFPKQSGCLPNPAWGTATQSPPGTRKARQWLREKLGHNGPVWLMPCRLLRRKNIGEALLFARWLRPDAWLVTTANVTSPDEQPYAERLATAAKEHGWPLRLSILANPEKRTPRIGDLFGASEVILLTSLQEGFGLPYIEAAVARRALIARTLPNIAPDLASWGLSFPQAYDELLVHSELFDLRAERARQDRLFRTWLNALPSGLRRFAGEPVVLGLGPNCDAVPFSRLTLTAQLQVLAHPAEISWAACISLNPWLHAWRDAAAKCALGLTTWPVSASRRLSGETFARGFARILKTKPTQQPPAGTSSAAQCEFIKDKLQGSNLYPLTWAPVT